MTPVRRRWAVAAALAVGVAGGAIGTAVAVGDERTEATAGGMGGAGAMMGSGRMGASGLVMPGRAGDDGSATLVPASRMEAAAAAAACQAHIDGTTVAYTSTQVHLVALGAPGSRPGMFWEVDGVVNPTVVVPAGARITVEFADGDPGYQHGFEVTAAPPPYPSMAMMGAGVVAPGAFVMPVAAPRGASWYSETTTFTAPPAGTYYYLCPVPGHARQGMWGKLIVR